MTRMHTATSMMPADVTDPTNVMASFAPICSNSISSSGAPTKALTAFAGCLKVALQSATFHEDTSFSEADRQHYKETLKQFTSLRQMVQQDAGERIDYDAYAEQVKKLLDKHVVGVEIKDAQGAYDVTRLGAEQRPAIKHAELKQSA